MVAATKRSHGWIAAFTLLALWALVFVGVFSIGPVFLPVALFVTLAWLVYVALRYGVRGVLAGLAIVLLYLAYLNIGGPEPACAVHRCHHEWNPGMLTAVGLALGTCSAVTTLVHRRRRT